VSDAEVNALLEVVEHEGIDIFYVKIPVEFGSVRPGAQS
jgi:hypothetical protein